MSRYKTEFRQGSLHFPSTSAFLCVEYIVIPNTTDAKDSTRIIRENCSLIIDKLLVNKFKKMQLFSKPANDRRDLYFQQ